MAVIVSPDWRVWQRWLADAADLDQVADALAAVAAEVAAYLGPSEISHAQWRRLGVHVVVAPIGASGGCRRNGDEAIVLVSDRDHPRRQRFTVAHELGHLLLDEARARLRPTRLEEERLCDAFAAAILVPPDQLEQALAEVDRVGPGDVLDLCNRFGVGLQPIMVALADFVAADEVLLVARLAGHPRRPAIVDFRFHAAAARDVYLPRHQRLTSVGLDRLAAWARSADAASAVGSGVARLELRRAATPRSGVAAGRVDWSAQVLPNRILVAALDVAAMQVEWARAA
jgi:hypothetical protein